MIGEIEIGVLPDHDRVSSNVNGIDIFFTNYLEKKQFVIFLYSE